MLFITSRAFSWLSRFSMRDSDWAVKRFGLLPGKVYVKLILGLIFTLLPLSFDRRGVMSAPWSNKRLTLRCIHAGSLQLAFSHYYMLLVP